MMDGRTQRRRRINMSSMTFSEVLESRGVEAIAEGDIDGGSDLIRIAKRARAGVERARGGEVFRKAAAAIVDDDEDDADDSAVQDSPQARRAKLRARIRRAMQTADARAEARILRELDEDLDEDLGDDVEKSADRAAAAMRLLERAASQLRKADLRLTAEGAIAKAAELHPRLASTFQDAFLDANLATTERESREFSKRLRRTGLSADSIADNVEVIAKNLQSRDQGLTDAQAVVKAIEMAPGLYDEYIYARESEA
jgi:hypothetical protein